MHILSTEKMVPADRRLHLHLQKHFNVKTVLLMATHAGICKSCKQAESHNHPDIIYITHDKSSISVNDIREQLNNDISIKPYSSEYKIYIIPDANKMTEQAQNALLKTIEEPPAYAVYTSHRKCGQSSSYNTITLRDTYHESVRQR